ncbi:MAG: hypothetical protein HYY44_07435 [Deltaproteobacteria bacterium]|nr:hypothetical protein [Deltaproteobacteria bacterium]MBI4374783.1 hypothetical protein [Deltaproteobacteria bacterium]
MSIVSSIGGGVGTTVAVLAGLVACRFSHSWYGSQREWERIVKEKPGHRPSDIRIPLQGGNSVLLWRDDRVRGEFLGRLSGECGPLWPSQLFENLDKITQVLCRPTERFEITSEPTDCGEIFRGACVAVGANHSGQQ